MDPIKIEPFARSYRVCSNQSSLNPAIALKLNELAGLDENDRILDPCCGTATILIERQLIKPCFCIGVDIDPRILDCAKKNIKLASVKYINIKHADIKQIKFPERKFTKIISNLPYGIHSGSRQQNIELYRYLAQMSEKWLATGGKVVFLTTAKTILWNAFADIKLMKFVSETPLQIHGLNPSVYIYEKIKG